jgi:hypothetical protein
VCTQLELKILEVKNSFDILYIIYTWDDNIKMEEILSENEDGQLKGPVADSRKKYEGPPRSREL